MSISDTCILSDSIIQHKNSLLNYGVRCYSVNKLSLPNYDGPNDYVNLYKSVFFLKNRQFKNFNDQNYIIDNPDLEKIHVGLLILNKSFIIAQKKSPFLAATLSTAIPGLGKVYAGRPAEMIQPLLKCLVGGVVAYEGYRKNEFKSFTFYLFGAYGVFNYISSIVGSYYSVKTRKADENKWLDNELENSFYHISTHLIEN